MKWKLYIILSEIKNNRLCPPALVRLIDDLRYSDYFEEIWRDY